MDNGLFRKKSMERISSPEELHDYMRVTSPRLWMILAAVVLLLVGFIVYASTVNMENVMPVKVLVEKYHLSAEESASGEERDGTMVYSELPADQLDVVKTGMTVRFRNESGYVSWISMFADEDLIQVVYEMEELNYPLAAGEYDAELVLETTTPIRFLWN